MSAEDSVLRDGSHEADGAGLNARRSRERGMSSSFRRTTVAAMRHQKPPEECTFTFTFICHPGKTHNLRGDTSRRAQNPRRAGHRRDVCVPSVPEESRAQTGHTRVNSDAQTILTTIKYMYQYAETSRTKL